MDATIGINAGKIWSLLKAKGDLSFGQIQKGIRETERHTALALGWLAREDKLKFDQDGNRMIISLKEI